MMTSDTMATWSSASRTQEGSNAVKRCRSKSTTRCDEERKSPCTDRGRTMDRSRPASRASSMDFIRKVPVSPFCRDDEDQHHDSIERQRLNDTIRATNKQRLLLQDLFSNSSHCQSVNSPIKRNSHEPVLDAEIPKHYVKNLAKIFQNDSLKIWSPGISVDSNRPPKKDIDSSKAIVNLKSNCDNNDSANENSFKRDLEKCLAGTVENLTANSMGNELGTVVSEGNREGTRKSITDGKKGTYNGLKESKSSQADNQVAYVALDYRQAAEPKMLADESHGKKSSARIGRSSSVKSNSCKSKRDDGGHVKYINMNETARDADQYVSAELVQCANSVKRKDSNGKIKSTNAKHFQQSVIKQQVGVNAATDNSMDSSKLLQNALDSSKSSKRGMDTSLRELDSILASAYAHDNISSSNGRGHTKDASGKTSNGEVACSSSPGGDDDLHGQPVVSVMTTDHVRQQLHHAGSLPEGSLPANAGNEAESENVYCEVEVNSDHGEVTAPLVEQTPTQATVTRSDSGSSAGASVARSSSVATTASSSCGLSDSSDCGRGKAPGGGRTAAAAARSGEVPPPRKAGQLRTKRKSYLLESMELSFYTGHDSLPRPPPGHHSSEDDSLGPDTTITTVTAPFSPMTTDMSSSGCSSDNDNGHYGHSGQWSPDETIVNHNEVRTGKDFLEHNILAEQNVLRNGYLEHEHDVLRGGLSNEHNSLRNKEGGRSYYHERGDVSDSGASSTRGHVHTNGCYGHKRQVKHADRYRVEAVHSHSMPTLPAMGKHTSTSRSNGRNQSARIEVDNAPRLEVDTTTDGLNSKDPKVLLRSAHLSNELVRLSQLLDTLPPADLRRFLVSRLRQRDSKAIIALGVILPRVSFPAPEHVHCVRCHKNYNPSHDYVMARFRHNSACTLKHPVAYVVKTGLQAGGAGATGFYCKACDGEFALHGLTQYDEKVNSHMAGFCFNGQHTTNPGQVNYSGIVKTCEENGCVECYV